MKTFLQAKLIAHIDMPDEYLEFITECCKHHYDYTVQSMIRQGGFLYGAKNRREFSKGEDKMLELDFRQIDTIFPQ